MVKLIGWIVSGKPLRHGTVQCLDGLWDLLIDLLESCMTMLVALSYLMNPRLDSFWSKRAKHQLSTMSSCSSMGSDIEMISEDLVFQILLWLPVTSLIRFKSVCKFWLSHIESRSFISQHTRCSNSEDNLENKLIAQNYFEVDSASTHKFMCVIDLKLSKRVDFKLNTDYKVSGAKLISSFDGIICLAHQMSISEWFRNGSVEEDIDFDRDLFSHDLINVVSLLNPATGHVKILPPPLEKHGSEISDYFCRIDYGFGIDVKTNAYRVVRVIVQELKANINVLRSHVEVYSLKTDSWRVVDAIVPLKIWITSTPRRPSRNGVCYWFGQDFISKDPIVLSFDFSNEVFGIIPVKELFGELQVFGDDYNESELVLSFLREKLACIRFVPKSSYVKCRHCKVWVLSNCGVEESWVELYTIMLEQSTSSISPLGFTADGKMVLEEKKFGRDEILLLWNPVTENFRYTPFRGTFYNHVVYKESLISFEGASGETDQVDNKVI